MNRAELDIHGGCRTRKEKSTTHRAKLDIRYDVPAGRDGAQSVARCAEAIPASTHTLNPSSTVKMGFPQHDRERQSRVQITRDTFLEGL